MTRAPRRLRIVTYNVHRCGGLDRRVSPARIAKILKEIDADIAALQEVSSLAAIDKELDQARYLARELNCAYEMGENRKLNGGAYGNVVLSRLPILSSRNHDISWKRRERRGCLQVDLEIGSGRILHIFNVHLGTSYLT